MSKTDPRYKYPVEAKDVSNLLTRVEPVLTPELLRSRYLKQMEKLGVDNYSDDDLKDKIHLAINEIEVLLNLNLYKIQYQERIPFDAALYRNFLFMKLNHGPIISIDSLRIESSDGVNYYTIPSEWIDRGFFHKRQINIIPLIATLSGQSNAFSGPASGAVILMQAQLGTHWLPAYWMVDYTSGVCNRDGNFPVIINQIVGMTAAIMVLSDLQTNFIYNSESLSQDGISQSQSGPGNQVFLPRIQYLTEERDKLLSKVKGLFYNKLFLSNI